MYEDTLLQLSKDTQFRISEPISSPLSERRNPACGDEVSLSADLRHGKIEKLSFHAQGCAVCVASSTALSIHLNGCDLETARTRINQAMDFFNSDSTTEWRADWGAPDLPALGAVRARPMRMHCVKLPWLALQDAL
ncbi:iron-sulfur cluster assembly scaffold protein [Kiritimatiellota bacterium B12222]|nr:iron-sulfur cluster assembly scaffold protein [Kiritimatiellota bacterium B12222]